MDKAMTYRQALLLSLLLKNGSIYYGFHGLVGSPSGNRPFSPNAISKAMNKLIEMGIAKRGDDGWELKKSWVHR